MKVFDIKKLFVLPDVHNIDVSFTDPSNITVKISGLQGQMNMKAKLWNWLMHEDETIDVKIKTGNDKEHKF